MVFHRFAEVTARARDPSDLTRQPEIAVHAERSRERFVEEEALPEGTRTGVVRIGIRGVSWNGGQRSELFERRSFHRAYGLDATGFDATGAALLPARTASTTRRITACPLTRITARRRPRSSAATRSSASSAGR